MSHNEGQYDVGTSFHFDNENEALSTFRRQNEQFETPCERWKHPPSRGDKIGSTSKSVQIFSHEVPNKLNNPLPPFQIEYGILISELLQSCNLRLEELRFSENRTECSVWNDDGTLKTFIIEKNLQNPLEYSVNYKTSNKEGLSSEVEPVLQFKRSTKPPSLGNEKVVPKEGKCLRESRNRFANRLTDDKQEELQTHNGSSYELINPNYAPYPKHLQLQLNIQSSDSSLYEETTQFKRGDVITVERFQRYKIRPNGKCGQDTKHGEALGLISGHQVDTEISPRVPMSGGRYVESVKQHVHNKFKPLPSTKQSNNVSIHSPESSTTTRNKPNIFIGTPKSLQNYETTVNNTPGKEVSSKCISRHNIPLIKFIKPQARVIPFNIAKVYVLPSKSKLKGSIRKFKRTVSKNVSNAGVNTRFNQSEALGSINVLELDGTPTAIINRQTQRISQTKLSDEMKTAVSKRVTIDCTSKENTNHERIFLSNNQSVKGEFNLKKIVYMEKERPHSLPPKYRALTNPSAVGNEDHINSSNTFESKHELGAKEEFASETETSRVIENLVPFRNTQLEETTISFHNIKQHRSTTSSVKSCVEADDYDFEDDVTRHSDALNGEVNSPIKSDSQELHESISNVPVLLAASDPRVTKGIRPLAETKEQELSRLKDQIGKVSLTSDDIQSEKIELNVPQTFSTSTKHIETPEVLWQSQKVKLNKETYLQKCASEKRTLSHTERTQRESPRWRIEDDVNHSDGQSHKENKSEDIPVINTKNIYKEVHNEKGDNDEQCCLM